MTLPSPLENIHPNTDATDVAVDGPWLTLHRIEDIKKFHEGDRAFCRLERCESDQSKKPIKNILEHLRRQHGEILKMVRGPPGPRKQCPVCHKLMSASNVSKCRHTLLQKEKLALGSPVASRPSTAANTRHSPCNDKEWKQKALQDLMCRFGDGQEAMTHGERTNRNLYRYLVNASPPNLDESKGDIDARFCTTHEDCKKALTKTNNLIIAKDQQSYKWPLGKPPIQQFLAQWRDGPDLEVCVQIPSRSIDETSYEKLTIGELTQRFLADKASDDPVNALDIRSHSPNIYPRMLEPDSCRFLHLIIDASLSIKSAQRDAASTGEARQHKNLFEGSLVGQRGSNTDVHLDANGFATWITPQDGEFGFIWLTRLTADDMEGWIKDRSYDKDKVRYVVAKPGQTIFIPPGTPHGVVRLEDTLSITGHFLKWSDIDSWLRIMDLQREHPRITNEDMTKDSMLRLLEPALNIIQGRIERDDVEEMGGQDEAREIEEKAKVRLHLEVIMASLTWM
ncbi:hypothetical protein FPOAC2_13400 [Fusarium poae]